jgi:hydroxyacylglutathione hydrolase
MRVKTLPVGAIQANCYLVWCEESNEAAVIDPGDEGQRILAEISRLGLQVKYIVNTHGHADHIGGNATVKQGTGAQLAIHPADLPLLSDTGLNLSTWMGKPFTCPKPDILLSEGQQLSVGKLTLTVLATPGHTRGGVSLKTDGAIFTGDTLFAGSVGRTDFPGGSFDDMIKSIREKILVCDDAVEVYPGHGPSSTVGYERENNPYL